MADFNDRIRKHDEWMEHFQAKLDALIDIIMRREGGPEAG
jgi:hypothetical protein